MTARSFHYGAPVTCVIGAVMLVLLASPSADGAGVTSHSVIAENARAQMTFSNPELAGFLLLHRDAFQSGVMFPDSSQTYFQKDDVTTNIDNLTHGNQQGHDGIINRYIRLLREKCPGDPANGSWACQREYAFLLGMIAHDVGDAIPHDRFMGAIASECGFPTESDSEDATSGHRFSDTNVDICLARQLNGNYVNPVVYEPLSDHSSPCERFTDAQFSDGMSCYKCPSGYSRLLDLSLLNGTPFEGANVPVCYKRKCLDNLLATCDTGQVYVPLACAPFAGCYTYVWATDLGSICPSGQGYDPIYHECVSCPDRYTRNPLAGLSSDYACQATVNCNLVSVWDAGFIPVLQMELNNRAAPSVLFLGGYDLGDTAWPDDPQFTGQDVFDLDDLKAAVTEVWGMTFIPEHLPLPWEVQIPGIEPVNIAFVNFEGDPTACDWAYTNAFSGEAYLLQAADDVQDMIEVLWAELKTDRDVKVKRRSAYKYMVVEDDRIVRAQNTVANNNGYGDDINYSLDMGAGSGAGSAYFEVARIYCEPDPCFEANYVVAAPLPGEELIRWETKTDSGWVEGGDCANGLVYRNEDRSCRAFFTKNHPPQTAATLSPSPNDRGWNRGDVMITLTSEIWEGHPDLASGEYHMSGAHCNATLFIPPECRGTPAVVSASTTEWLSQVVRSEGLTTLSFQATDELGIQETLKSVDVRIDRTPPTLSITTPAEGAIYVAGWEVPAEYLCSDALSGVDTCEGNEVAGLIDTSVVGDRTFTAVVTDMAGNLVTRSVAYRVEELPSMSIGDSADVVEGNPGDGVILTFPVILVNPISFPVTVVATTTSYTAVAGDDFVEVQTTLTFAPGETRKDVVVLVIGDHFAELEESFFVTLSSPVNATILDGEAVGTIRNDDVAVVPDPAIKVTGCTKVGGPCVIESYSRSGLTTEGWSYGWYVDGVGAGHDRVLGAAPVNEGTHEIVLDVTTLVGQASDRAVVSLAPACAPGHLCMLSSIFEVSVEAVDPRTGTGAFGVPVVESNLFGWFAFPDLTGSPDNPEVFVKILDGRRDNGHYWVFYGALTDFALRIEVTNTSTGEATIYDRPAGTSAGGFDVGGGVTPEECAGQVDGVKIAPPLPSTCGGPEALCLQGGRFQVRLEARDHRTGAVAPGVAMPSNDIFGYFAIPDLTGTTENAEVFVKVLDGRVVDGHFWVFFAGLTDLEYTLTVTDVDAGVTRTYTKAGGSACGAYDTDGF